MIAPITQLLPVLIAIPGFYLSVLAAVIVAVLKQIALRFAGAIWPLWHRSPAKMLAIPSSMQSVPDIYTAAASKQITLLSAGAHKIIAAGRPAPTVLMPALDFLRSAPDGNTAAALK